MALPTQPAESPVGELEWVFIDGEGKDNMNKDGKIFTLDVVMSEEQAQPFIDRINSFWEDNKPKGAKKPKSLGFWPHTVKDEEASKEADEPVYVETGNIKFTFSTKTKYTSGDPKIITIFNSKGNEVSLMGKKVGNGSRGRPQGQMGIYDFNAASKGVSLYLNAVQLSKFVEYVGGANFNAIDDDEDAFDGVDGAMGGIPDEQTPKPRL